MNAFTSRDLPAVRLRARHVTGFAICAAGVAAMLANLVRLFA